MALSPVFSFDHSAQLPQAYIDKMSELLLHEHLGESPGNPQVETIARARTVTVLRILDPARRGSLIRFLSQAGILTKCFEDELMRMDLRGANLCRVNLSWIKLGNADLSGADLSGANLSLANLSGANLSGAHLSQADLSRAHLGGANLFGANLISANLSNASLIHANLSGAILNDANLSRAELKNATIANEHSLLKNRSRRYYQRSTKRYYLMYNRTGTRLSSVSAQKAVLVNYCCEKERTDVLYWR